MENLSDCSPKLIVQYIGFWKDVGQCLKLQHYAGFDLLPTSNLQLQVKDPEFNNMRQYEWNHILLCYYGNKQETITN